VQLTGSGTRKVVGQNETISSFQQYQSLEVAEGNTLLVDLSTNINTQCLNVRGNIQLVVPAAQSNVLSVQSNFVPITFSHSYQPLENAALTVLKEEKCRQYDAQLEVTPQTDLASGKLIMSVNGAAVPNCSDLSESTVFVLAFVLGIGLPLIIALVVVIVLLRKGRFRRTIRQKVSLDILNTLADKSFLTPASSIKLDRELGSGSFGKVYDGKWQQTQVAFKYCNVPSKMEEFLHEAALMMKLTPHPNVVQLLAISIDGAEPVIVLEYCDGGSMDNLLFDSANPISNDDKIRLAAGTSTSKKI
jgi:hypothetical protein